MADMDEEERRIQALLDKKQNAKFEEHRRQALAAAQAKGHGTNFKLAEPEAKPEKKMGSPSHGGSAPRPAAAFSSSAAADSEYERERAAREAEERQRAIRETIGQGSLGDYEKRQAQADQDLKKRLEDADREKQAAMSGGSGLAAYQERMIREEHEARRKREDDERHKLDAVKAAGQSTLALYEERSRKEEQERQRRLAEAEAEKSSKLASGSTELERYKARQAAEEAEFRRKKEEDEAHRRAQLEAMERADAERRMAALSLAQQQDAQRAADARAAAAAAPKPKCATCSLELLKEQQVPVKGKIYCYGCSIGAGADKCTACSKPIIGTTVKAGAKKFHPDCLRCAKCDKPLTSGFRMRRNAMVCPECS